MTQCLLEVAVKQMEMKMPSGLALALGPVRGMGVTDGRTGRDWAKLENLTTSVTAQEIKNVF